MSRIIGVALVLIILVDNFYDSTAAHAGFHVSKMHIRKCRCRGFHNGKIKCPSRLHPTDYLVKCLCSKTNRHKFPEFQTICILRRLNISTPL